MSKAGASAYGYRIGIRFLHSDSEGLIYDAAFYDYLELRIANS